MASTRIIFLLSLTSLALGQRPFFAGSKPIGYPELTEKETGDELGNRFGEDGVTTSPRPLPIEAQGDRELVERLSKLPIDKQPFWLINWQALDQNRKNPQSYPQRPNVFLESLRPGSQSSNSNGVSSNSGSLSSTSSNSASSSNSAANSNIGTRRDPITPGFNIPEVNPNPPKVNSNAPAANSAATSNVVNRNSDTGNSNAGLSNKNSHSSQGNRDETKSGDSHRRSTTVRPVSEHFDSELGNRFSGFDESEDDDYKFEYGEILLNTENRHSGNINSKTTKVG